MTEAEWIAFLQRPEIPAFNRAMLAAPDDDLPRLVFCDWLDEHCPDVRVGAVVRESMSGRSQTIQFLPIPGEVGVTAYRGRLHLSFGVNSPPIEFARSPIWEAGWVGGVRLHTTHPAAVRDWLSHPQMSGVEWMEVNDAGVHDAGVEVAEIVAASDHLTAVRHLDLSMCELGADGVRALTTPKLPALRSLTLYNSALHEDGAVAIASAPVFAPLTALDVANNQLGPRGVRALADSPHLTRLRSLRLSHNQIGNEGLTTVARWSSVDSLQKLDVAANLIGSDGIGAFCDSGHFGSMTSLDLSENRIGDSGVRVLARWPHLSRLQTLNLASCFDSADGAVALAESPHLHDLRSLNLSDNPMGDAGLIALASSPLFARLDKLTLGSCGITVAGLRAIANAPRFADPRPLELWLTGNAFGEDDQAVADELPPTLAAAVRNAIDWGIDRR